MTNGPRPPRIRRVDGVVAPLEPSDRGSSVGRSESRPGELWAMLLILGVALGIRWVLFVLAPGPLQLSDEFPGALQDQLMQRPWPSLLRCDFERGPRPALLNFLLRSAFQIGGVGTASVLVLGMLTSSVTAAAVCGATILRFGRSAGLLAGLLMAALPVHVSAGLSMDATAVVPAILALGWWVGERSVGTEGKGGVVLALASGGLLSCAVLARYEAALLVGVFLGCWCVAVGCKQHRARAAAGALGTASGLLYFPTCGLLAGDMLRFYNDQLTTSGLGLDVQALSPLTSMTVWSGYILLPLGFVGIPLALLGVWNRGRTRQGFFPLAGFLSLALFLIWRSVTTSLEPEGRYVYVLVAGATVAVGIGGQAVLSWWSRKRSVVGRGPGGTLVVWVIVLAGAFATLPLLPGRIGPAREAGRLPVHEPEVRQLMGVLDDLGGEGRILFVDGPTDIPRQPLLIHARLGHQDQVEFLRDLMSPSDVTAAECDDATLSGAAVVIADGPLDSDLDARLRAGGWTQGRAARWELRFPPGRIQTP